VCATHDWETVASLHHAAAVPIKTTVRMTSYKNSTLRDLSFVYARVCDFIQTNNHNRVHDTYKHKQ